MAREDDIAWQIYKYGRMHKLHSCGTFPSWNKLQQKKYHDKKYSAIRAGIDWQLSYEEWLEVWGTLLYSRGKGRLDYHICRINEPGPYAAHNVYIGTPKDNTQDRIANSGRKNAREQGRLGRIEI